MSAIFELVVMMLVGLNKVFCRLVKNPAAMVVVPQTIKEELAASVWAVVTEQKWETRKDGKKTKAKKFSSLIKSDREYEIPVNSPIYKWILAGRVKTARLVDIPRGMKYVAFEYFAKMANAQGYVVLPPDFKESEPRITYAKEEEFCALFNVSAPYFRSKIASWGKWAKYVWTPSKVLIDQEIECIYLETPDRDGHAVGDGVIPAFFTWEVMKESGVALWSGLTNFVQVRHHVSSPEEKSEIGVAIKGLICSDGQVVLDAAKQVLNETGRQPADFGNLLVLNQHSVKYFDGGAAIKKLENGTIWKQKMRLIGIKVRSKGSSRVSGQEVSQNPRAIRTLLKHHGLEKSANNLVQYVKGTPEAILEQASHFEKVDTNQYLNLLYMVNIEGSWFQNRMPSVHNRHLAMCESLYRDTIIGTKINNKSSYQFWDSRCDKAIMDHYNATGEWRLFVTPELGSKLDSKGRVIYGKSPNHSRYCLVTAYALKDVHGDYIFAPEGGMGLPSMLSNLVKGLDFDGDLAGSGEHPEEMEDLRADFHSIMSPAVKEPKEAFIAPETLEQISEAVLAGSKASANATFAIGYVSLAVRYCIMYCNLNNISISDEMMLEIGKVQEDGIQEGAKTVKKNSGKSTLDCSCALENGDLLIENVFLFMEYLIGCKFPRFSDWGELNPSNLAEICHQLMNRGGGSKSRSHKDIFKHRVEVVLPAYKNNRGDKSGFARDFAFDILADAGLDSFMEPDKSHCQIFQRENQAVWSLIKSSYRVHGWSYSFTIEQIEEFGNWLFNLYRNKTNGYNKAFSGERDRETGEMLALGHWDVKLKQEQYQRLNRALRFWFYGIEPHGYDLEFDKLNLGDTWKKFKGIYKKKDSEWFKFLVYMFAYVGSFAFNATGKNGNSGGICMRFPSSVHLEVKKMYYALTPEGKKEVEAGKMNPFLDKVEKLASDFERVQIRNDLEWIEKHPYEISYEAPDSDEEGFDADYISDEFELDSDCDSID